MEIRKAERKQKKLKMAIQGVSGGGKTWTALEIATGLKGDGRILLIDTEQSSSELYAEDFDFDVLNLERTEVSDYLNAFNLAVKKKYTVLIIDSLSHAWEWLLEEHDNVTKRSKSQNSYQAWGDVTPIYKQLIKGIVSSPIHIIATMRSKSEYVQEEYQDSKGNKKTRPVKVGLAPIFRQGGEYEFDLITVMDLEHNMVTEKTRISFMDNKVIKKPKAELGEKLLKWLNSGRNLEQEKKEQEEKQRLLEESCPFAYNFAELSAEIKKEIFETELKTIKWVKATSGLVRTEKRLSDKRDAYLIEYPEPNFSNDDLPENFNNKEEVVTQ